MVFCAISGEPPQDPVVSVKSGCIYERRIIVKYITENGTDPITGDKLEESDLIELKASPKTAPPRPPSHTSLPALLHTLQNEYDAIVLELFSLRQKYNSVRQELSYALYSQDAATRVVARLIRERDAAREALANVQASMGMAPSATADGGDVEMGEGGAAEEGLPASVVAQIDETHATLSSARKKRKPPTGYATTGEVKTYTVKHIVPSLHSASPAGITSLAVSRVDPFQFLTGGNDKIVQLYNRSTDKALTTLKGHSKKINHVAFREREGEKTLLLSASADKTAKIWSRDDASGEYITNSTLRTHKGEISGLAVHPTSTLAVYSSLDKTYSIHDLTSFAQVFRSAPSDEPFTSLGVHPDGTLIAAGTPTSTIQIFDIRTGAIAATLTPSEGTPFAVTSLAFSENGYHMLAPDSLSSVSIWDLRKTKSTHSIPLGENFKVNRVTYDQSAQFLAVSGNQGARIFSHKSWEELTCIEEGSDISDLVFGDQGKEISVVVGREVKIWGSA